MAPFFCLQNEAAVWPCALPFTHVRTKCSVVARNLTHRKINSSAPQALSAVEISVSEYFAEMSFPLLILGSLAISTLVYTSISAIPDSLKEISAQAVGCPADVGESWSYSGRNGPATWGLTFSQCKGASQSPIAVNSSRVLIDENLEKLSFAFYNYSIVNMTIKNDGRTIKVAPDNPPGRLMVVNKTAYDLYEITFHWGSTMRTGSEHIIDGKQYAMEMHLFHRREENEESKQAVLAVFFEQFAGINAELQHIVNELPKVMYKNAFTVSRWRLNLLNLLPELNMTSFYYYNGSLTLPDCAENVSWILLKTPVFIGKAQIEEFRKMYSVTEYQKDPRCRITGNIRPVQDLNGRQVYSSK